MTIRIFLLLLFAMEVSLFAAREWDGTSANYAGASSLLCTPPFTVVAFFKVDDVTTRRSLLVCGSTANAHGYKLELRGDIGGDPVRAESAGPASCFQSAGTSTGYSASTWHVAGATWNTDADRRVYLDGGSKGTNTNSCVPSVNNTRIGVHENIGGIERIFDGLIDRICIWTVALTDDEHAAVARARSCRGVRPGSLTQIIPMLRATSPLLNLGRTGTSFTVTGSLPRAADRYPASESF